MSVEAIDDALFDAVVLKPQGLVLVDFWATWCGPCRMLAPILERFAEENGGRLRIVKMDIDKCPATVSRYNIRSAPTLVMFRNGQAVETRVGIMTRSQLASWVGLLETS